MATYNMTAEKWEKTREKGKMRYILFKTVLLDFILGLPFFMVLAPLIRSGFNLDHVRGYLLSGNIMRDIIIYSIIIFAIRIIFRYSTWNYNECKFKLWKKEKREN